MQKQKMKILIALLLVAGGLGVWFCRYFSNDSIRVFVTYYKPMDSSYHLLKDSPYMIPIQVGRAIENEPFMGGKLSSSDIEWLHERMIGDDTGDNISARNREFDVLSAYWWVWKHYMEVGNPKYIGFFAHRKWLHIGRNDATYIGISDDKSAKIHIDILKEHKVIAYHWNEGRSAWANYFSAHNISDLNKMMKIIERDYPEMTKVMYKVLYDDKVNYAVFNFWIMEKELAFDYFEKLFDVMFKLEKEIGAEVRKRDLMQRRVFGYLAERFYAVWLAYQEEDGKVSPYWADVGYF